MSAGTSFPSRSTGPSTSGCSSSAPGKIRLPHPSRPPTRTSSSSIRPVMSRSSRRASLSSAEIAMLELPFSPELVHFAWLMRGRDDPHGPAGPGEGGWPFTWAAGSTTPSTTTARGSASSTTSPWPSRRLRKRAPPEDHGGRLRPPPGQRHGPYPSRKGLRLYLLHPPDGHLSFDEAAAQPWISDSGRATGMRNTWRPSGLHFPRLYEEFRPTW